MDGTVIKQPSVLHHEPHRATQPPAFHFVEMIDTVAGNDNFARSRSNKPCEEFQYGALSASCRSAEQYEFPPSYCERDAVDNHGAVNDNARGMKLKEGLRNCRSH